jgi:hypothetical protein
MMRFFGILVFVLIEFSIGNCQEAGFDANAFAARERKEILDRMSQTLERPPFPMVPIDLNSFKGNPTIHAHMNLIGMASPSLQWFTSSTWREIDGKSEEFRVREVLLKQMRVSPEDVKDVDKLFEVRMNRHKENLLVLKGAELRERDVLMVEKGIPAGLLKHLGLPVLSKQAIDELLVKYSKLEREAETKLYGDLNEVIDPLQFETLVHKWVNYHTLYIPIAEKYLDLSDNQLPELEEKCIAAFGMMRELSRTCLTLPAVEREKVFENERWIETRLRPFSKLNPKQFRIAASFLLRDWRTTGSFAERLLKLEEDKSMIGKCELKVLGELYREGRALEAK